MSEREPAFAIEVTVENMQVILSEAGPHLTKEMLVGWLDTFEGGFFVRHPGEAWDCDLFDADIFSDFYKFRRRDDPELFKRIVLKR